MPQYWLPREPFNSMPSLNAPLLSESRFTPEAIASIIEQLRKREDIKITEIKDELDCVKVMGKVRVGE